jgi:WD40 repeat protein
MAAIACSDGIIRIYNLNTSNKLIELSTNTGNEKVACTTLRWRPSNESLGTTFNSTILVANGAGTIYQFFAKAAKGFSNLKRLTTTSSRWTTTQKEHCSPRLVMIASFAFTTNSQRRSNTTCRALLGTNRAITIGCSGYGSVPTTKILFLVVDGTRTYG